MTSLGEWDEVDAAGPAPAAGVQGEVAAALGSLDVAGLAGQLVATTVTKEIQRQIQRQVAPVVTEAVASVLTAEKLAALRVAAAAAAESELAPATAEDAPQASPDHDDQQEPVLYYGSVDEFVRDFICPVFRRRVAEGLRAEHRWSARWWVSAEAIIRLEALWRSWEHLRLDAATGMSVWLRDHADHHLGVLMSPDGPFARSKDTATADDPLPYEPPPDGLFPDVRTGGPER